MHTYNLSVLFLEEPDSIGVTSAFLHLCKDLHFVKERKILTIDIFIRS